ncbi:MAG: hypothetical protein WA130_00760 [Candidatus Methanoperedens sp.]
MTILLLTAIALIIITTGCISREVQGAKIFVDAGYALGAIGENQTDIQKISWNVNIANIGVKTAENVTAYIILNPEIVSRQINIEENIVQLGGLKPDAGKGFKGNATFNASGMSKQEIAAWEPYAKIKVTWIEDGKPTTFES